MHYYSIQMVYFFKKCLDLTASNLNGWRAFFKSIPSFFTDFLAF